MITDFYLPLFFGLIHIRAYQSEADNHFFTTVMFACLSVFVFVGFYGKPNKVKGYFSPLFHMFPFVSENEPG